MEIVFADGYDKIVRYNKKDYENSNCNLVSDCTRISASYETNNENFTSFEEAMADFNCDMFNFFDTEKDSLIYVLYNDNKPVSFAIFRNKQEGEYLMEFIMTNKEYRGMGFATKLGFCSMKDLKDNFDAKNVCAVVNDKNSASQYLQEDFMKFNGLEFLGIEDGDGVKEYFYDIANLESMEDEIETM